MSGPGGALPELAWLPVDKLDANPEYQRTLDTARSQKLIARIAAEFDWRRFGALIAAPNGEDRWWLVDGQHPAAAARVRGDIAHLPAVVHAHAGLGELAAAFVGANRDRVPMSRQAMFRAQLVAGDAQAVRLKAMCDAAGFELLPYHAAAAQWPAGKTAAVPALLSLLRDYGTGATTERAILAVGTAWRHRPGALRGELFHAAAMWLHRRGANSRGLLDAALARLDIRKVEETVHATAGGQGSRHAAVFELLVRTADKLPPSTAAARPSEGCSQEPPARRVDAERAVAAAVEPNRIPRGAVRYGSRGPRHRYEGRHSAGGGPHAGGGFRRGSARRSVTLRRAAAMPQMWPRICPVAPQPALLRAGMPANAGAPRRLSQGAARNERADRARERNAPGAGGAAALAAGMAFRGGDRPGSAGAARHAVFQAPRQRHAVPLPGRPGGNRRARLAGKAAMSDPLLIDSQGERAK